MPNWCYNWLTISSRDDDAEKVHEVMDFLKGGDEPLDFSRVIPEPLGLEGMDGYDWRVANWGTKWNVRDARVDRDGVAATYSFETAWAPCVPVVERLAALFPDLEFSLAYDEPGMDFGGYVFYRDGEIEDEVTGSSKMVSWVEMADDRRAFG